MLTRGFSLIATLLVLLGVFYGGRLYERHACHYDFPGTLTCRDFRQHVGSSAKK